jgi:hypothetical protein
VVQLYSGVVAVASGGAAFVEACQTLLDEPVHLRQERAEAMLNAVFSRSWEYTVEAVHNLLQTSCRQVDAALDQPEPMAATGTHNPMPLRRPA